MKIFGSGTQIFAVWGFLLMSITAYRASAQTMQVLEDKGFALKTTAPEWITTYVTEGNIMAVEALPEYRDKYCFIGESTGSDLEFTLALVRQFDVKSQMDEMVRTSVAGALKAIQAGKGSLENAIDRYVNGELNVSYSGAQRTGDWWRQVRLYDADRRDVYKDEYRAYVFYTVPKRTLNVAVIEAIEKTLFPMELSDIIDALTMRMFTRPFDLREGISAASPAAK
jgi:hypothetical protein